MKRTEIIRMAQEVGFSDDEIDKCQLMFERFANLVAIAERDACIDLLMGLHEAQSNNGAHNHYYFASNALKELRGKTISIKLKEYKCTGCHGKWHNSEDAKHHSCKDFQ
jgi:hypothetical protein